LRVPEKVFLLVDSCAQARHKRIAFFSCLNTIPPHLFVEFMRMWHNRLLGSYCQLCVCIVLMSGWAVAQTPAVPVNVPLPHPIVLGFERFHATEATANAAGGSLLLGELNCTSCHAIGKELEGVIVKKQAPILTEIGARAKPEYLAKFLANPQATKPGTSMPNVFAGLPEAEAQANAEALAQFLATTGTLDMARPMKSAALRGEHLFHQVGCVACHGPRGEGKPAIAGSIPLGTPSRKYTFPGMVKFLTDPLKMRPSGRMPHMHLTEREANDVASFLLADIAIPSSLTYEYYEGSWDKLPEFDKLTPKSSGNCEIISSALGDRRDNYALRFTAVIEVKNEGNYNFYLTSDDGSRLSIDGQLVVDNDGFHPPAQKEGRFFLKTGRHAVEILYFEQGGGEELTVEVKGPGFKQAGLEALLAPPEAPAANAASTWTAKPELVEKGKQLFLTQGCAVCHELKQDNTRLTSTLKAESLNKLKPAGGCVSEQPTGKNPFFAFNAVQRQAVMAALQAARGSQETQSAPAVVVTQHFERFNCLGCHNRGELGGVEEARNEWFTGTMKEVGDEARLPPQLTNVGGKLKPEWLKKVLADGEKVRPYMHTRMPKFGGGNIGSLAEQLTQVDAASIPAAPKIDISDEDRKFKAAGKSLAGANGLGCIKCHTFNGKGTPGIQVMDLSVMAHRLNPDWYYHYMLNPPAFRPGTRMPAAWPGGQAVLKKVLSGDTPKQIRSTWAYLLDGKNAAEPAGLVEAKLELLPIDEPIIYRNFIEGAGPRAIAVGFPQKVNYAWDANHQRLAMIWQGAFIDAAMHWVGRGPGYQKPLGDNVLKFSDDAPLAILETNSTPWPKTTGRDEKDSNFKFHGYHLDEKRQPTFRYSMGDLKVEDLIQPHVVDGVANFSRKLRFASDKPVTNVYYLIAAGNTLELTADKKIVLNGNVHMLLNSQATSVLRESQGRKEVLLPIQLEKGVAEFDLEYEW
jgi:mono/diheme cytochrome c family protein